MKVHHVAIWVRDLERMRQFYADYFGCPHGRMYANPASGFESYFMRFDDSASVELMTSPSVRASDTRGDDVRPGFAHIALSLGTREKVIELTNRLRKDGYTIASEPRNTGDGYFESVVLDPEDNRIELTI